jgi:hypothetical protein
MCPHIRPRPGRATDPIGGLQPLPGDRADLRMHARVDLGAPRLWPGRWPGQPGPLALPRLVVDAQRDQEAGLGIAGQVLQDALGLRVGRVAEVRPARTARSFWATGPAFSVLPSGRSDAMS